MLYLFCLFLSGLFKLIFTRGGRGPVAIIMDIIALLMQFSICFMITRIYTIDNTPLNDLRTMAETIVAMALISFRYWENFIDCDIGVLNIQNFKHTLRIGRCKTYIFASLWKIGLSLAFIYILIPNMTPMAELFSNIRNETLFSEYNETSLEVRDIGNFSSDYVLPIHQEQEGASFRYFANILFSA